MKGLNGEDWRHTHAHAQTVRNTEMDLSVKQLTTMPGEWAASHGEES